MRLVCPNCDAEYEVDASVIPDTGRDVQCSNCGHAWFQQPPEAEAALAAEASLHDAPPARHDPQERTPSAAIGPDPTPAAPSTAAPEPQRRSIDESVLAVLREEAEREVDARRADPPAAFEMQTEMGLAAGHKAIAGVAAEAIGADPITKAANRREMLPEIEELNSTLRSSTEKRSASAHADIGADTAVAPKRSGFRSGFTLMILLAVALAVIYLMAPKLSDQFPAAAPALTSFVSMVDQMRLTFDGWIKSLIDFLRGLISKSA